MKLAALFSGGKDSTYAMLKAKKLHEIACLITIKSENKDSYMFHTPNIGMTKLQAESLGIPMIQVNTKGEKEKELYDLSKAIKKAIREYEVQGVVTGAVESVYQAARIQQICDELGIWCFNPLWQIDQLQLLRELLENKFEVIISGVAAYPFDESWLGRKIDENAISELGALQEKFKVSPSGEGGEIETLVLSCPLFMKPLVVKSAVKKYSSNAGIYEITEARLI